MPKDDTWGHIGLFTHCEQRGPRGAGLVRYALLPREDVLEVLPHLFVEDHVEEEDEDSLRRERNEICDKQGSKKKDVSLRYKHDPLSYLQTAEDREQVVEGHHVAVDRH